LDRCYHRARLLIEPSAFPVGIDRVQLEGGSPFLIAVPEKAFADKIHDDRGIGIRNQEKMQRYLIENLRIDTESLSKLRIEILSSLAERRRSRMLRLLNRVVARMQEGAHIMNDAVMRMLEKLFLKRTH
jgi:transcription initiation factor TFIIIB Brf1 subunit/transcription initiation factor TFIIB